MHTHPYTYQFWKSLEEELVVVTDFFYSLQLEAGVSWMSRQGLRETKWRNKMCDPVHPYTHTHTHTSNNHQLWDPYFCGNRGPSVTLSHHLWGRPWTPGTYWTELAAEQTFRWSMGWSDPDVVYIWLALVSVHAWVICSDICVHEQCRPSLCCQGYVHICGISMALSVPPHPSPVGGARTR